MRRRTVGILAVLLGLAPAVVAWKRADDTVLSLQPGSRMWIDGTSTVRSFRCSADSIRARVGSIESGAVSALLSGARPVLAAELQVPVRRLECGNGTMNEHMRKALKATEQPVITFTVSSYQLDWRGAATEGTATGELTLGGTRKTITVAATVTLEPEGVLRIAGTHEILMTEYGLKPPSLMLGAMRVNDKVTVGFDLLLKEGGEGLAAAR